MDKETQELLERVKHIIAVQVKKKESGNVKDFFLLIFSYSDWRCGRSG
jgi:hypothetical protein